MLWLRNVPDYEWVYVHCGNTAEHTEGCLLVGEKAESNVRISGSEKAYSRIYVPIVNAIDSGVQVSIEITNLDA